MKRFLIFSTLLVVSLGLTLTGSAVAQSEGTAIEENSTTNTTATETPIGTTTATPTRTETPTQTETEADPGPQISLDTSVNVSAETYAQEIDPNLRLVEWGYRNGEFRLLFESDRSKTVTITEAVQFERGAGSGRIYQQRLPEGQTEVSVPVPRRAGQAAVTMTTAASIERNSYSYVSTGQADVQHPPISYQRAQILVLLSVTGVAAFTFRVIRKRRNDEKKDWERIL